MLYPVAEKFISINGEARKAGELACFIRFAGCNIHCNYCDTRWACEKHAPFTYMSEEEIYSYIKASHVRNVTLTGGEPLIQPQLANLIYRLILDPELAVEIETNGTVSIAPYLGIPGDLTFTLDYKLPGSGMEDHMCLANMELAREQDTVKFVVSDRNDLNKMKEIIRQYDLLDRTSVYVSAVFDRIEPSDIVDYMIKNKLNGVKLQLQMHKFIWDPNKRGV